MNILFSSDLMRKWRDIQFKPTMCVHSLRTSVIGVARGPYPPKFVECLVIVCFERRYPKQNTVARLQSNILRHPTLWAGYATDFSYIRMEFWSKASTEATTSKHYATILFKTNLDNLLINFNFVSLVESSYLKTCICKFESPQVLKAEPSRLIPRKLTANESF